MDIARLAKILAIIFSVIGAIEFFSKYDQEITILIAIIGFVVGLTEDKESRQNFLMVTLVLLVGGQAVPSSLDSINYVGPFITEVMKNISHVFSAGALAIILTAMKNKVSN